MKKITAFFIVSLLLVLPARAEIMAMQPKIKLGIADRPGVMFVMLHNKGAATQLVSAKSDDFERVELHTHRKNPNGMMRMVQVDTFAVPANGILPLKPGGHHLMLFGFKGDKSNKSEAVEVRLKFADGNTLTVNAIPSQRDKPNRNKMHHHGH